MTSCNPQLPNSPTLDIAALSRLFKNTSTSYKFIFFLAILNKLQSKHWEADEPVQLLLEDLAVEMALLSWYPVKFYKLSFGWQDQVAKIINQLKFDPSFKAITSPHGQQQLRTAIKEQAKEIGLFSLLKFVPYRLLSPFFNTELKNIPERRKNESIAELAGQYTSQTIPLYSFVENNKPPSIRIHPEWLRYFLQAGNITIITDWVLWEWVNYLQKRNPNTPAIINKVLPPVKRASLNKQRSFWEEIIKADPSIRCIYSNELLIDQLQSKDSFSLDHFLPWTFVCHDQIWNLCPVTQSSNSSKGNKLPASDYIDRFIKQQIHAIKVSTDPKVILPRNRDRIIEAYSIDLHLDPNRLDNESVVYEAYTGLLKPMIALAEQNGFESGWTFQ